MRMTFAAQDDVSGMMTCIDRSRISLVAPVVVPVVSTLRFASASGRVSTTNSATPHSGKSIFSRDGATPEGPGDC